MDTNREIDTPQQSWRERGYAVIFEADTPAGRVFDISLLVAILLSVTVVMLDSVEYVRNTYERQLDSAEVFFTLLFSVEYAFRIACARRPLRYVFSFYGLVDLLAIAPTYLIWLVPGNEGSENVMVIRSLRLLRAFRIFKLAHMLREAAALRAAIWAARAKVAVFLSFVLIAVVIVGSAMYVIEGPERGFTSIPQGMYWAVVTMTTVGYGDTAPQSPFGKAIAAAMMMLGYSFIIVPTGIVSAEIAQSAGYVPGKRLTTQVCTDCMRKGHDQNALFCKFCGGKL